MSEMTKDEFWRDGDLFTSTPQTTPSSFFTMSTVDKTIDAKQPSLNGPTQLGPEVQLGSEVWGGNHTTGGGGEHTGLLTRPQPGIDTLLDSDPLFTSSWSSLAFSTSYDNAVSTYFRNVTDVTTDAIAPTTSSDCPDCYSSVHIVATAVTLAILVAGLVLNTSLFIYLVKLKLNNLFLVGIERLIILSEVLLSLTFLPIIVSITMATNLFPSVAVSQMYVSLWICMLILTLSLSLISSIIAIMEHHKSNIHQTSLIICTGTTIALSLALGLTVWILDLHVTCKHGFCWPQTETNGNSQIWGYSFSGLALTLVVIVTLISFIGIVLSTCLVERNKNEGYGGPYRSVPMIPVTERPGGDIKIMIQPSTIPQSPAITLSFLRRSQLSWYYVLVMLSVLFKTPIISVLALYSLNMIELKGEAESYVTIGSLVLLLLASTLLRPTFYMIFIKTYRKVCWC